MIPAGTQQWFKVLYQDPTTQETTVLVVPAENRPHAVYLTAVTVAGMGRLLTVVGVEETTAPWEREVQPRRRPRGACQRIRPTWYKPWTWFTSRTA